MRPPNIPVSVLELSAAHFEQHIQLALVVARVGVCRIRGHRVRL